VTDVEEISHRELERRAGVSIDSKKVMFAVSPTIYGGSTRTGGRRIRLRRRATSNG
jgi:hypothetical protein